MPSLSQMWRQSRTVTSLPIHWWAGSCATVPSVARPEYTGRVRVSSA
jgi:hypothetical protein